MLSAYILSTTDSGRGDEEHDHSLLFAFTPTTSSKGSTNTLKGLGLAVRGALESICGEKTQVLRLRQQQHGDISAVFAHLQACMVVLTLPGHLPDVIACNLVLQLAQSMVLLAGPSTQWTEQYNETGALSYAKIRRPLQPLFDRLCEGVLKQVSGPGFARGLPACVLQPGIMCLQLPWESHMQLDTLLRAHEAGGLLGQAAQAVQPRSQMQYNFYSRSCCLMYRGLAVWSGMTPSDTRLTWQLCWALGVHGQAQALPCQVTMHRVYPTAPGADTSSVDSGAASPGAEQEAALDQSHPTSLLILVSACHMVLAVALTAYDEDIEELAGQVEAHAAVELLAKVHTTFMTDLTHASAASALLAAVSRAPPDPPGPLGGFPGGAGQSPGSFTSPRGPGPGGAGGRSKTPGHHNSLFMRIIARSRPSGTATPSGGRSRAGAGAGAGAGHAPLLELPTSSSLPPPMDQVSPGSSSGVGGYSPRSAPSGPEAAAEQPPPPPPAGKGLRAVESARLAATPASTPASTPAANHRTRSAYAAGSGAAADGAASPLPPLAPTASPLTSPVGGAGPGSRLLGAGPNEGPGQAGSGPGPGPGAGAGVGAGGYPSSPLSLHSPGGGGRLTPPASPPTAAARGASPGSPLRQGLTEGAPAPNPNATHAVLHFDADTGRVTTTGDLPHVSMVADVWSAIGTCRALFAHSKVAVSVPPKHSRLCMTIQQIEQLSATRSQREGGQRLGSADATPWQYHPEVAGLAAVQQVTRRLHCTKHTPAVPWFVTAYKHADGHETYIVHADEVDEAAVLQELLGPKVASVTRLPSGMGTGTAASLPQTLSQALQSQPSAVRPGAAKNLVFG